MHCAVAVVGVLLLKLVLARFAAQYGRPPLHWAADYGRVKAIKTLVELKADLEVRTPVRHMPLPHYACCGTVHIYWS